MPAYIVFTKEHSRDAAESRRYLEHHDAFIKDHALTYRARFGRCETLEGAATEGVAILEFPTYAEAKRWYESAAYQEASKHRHLGGDYRCLLVEGVER